MNNKLLSIRYKQERRFVLMGMLAISLTITFLLILLSSIIIKGYSAFTTSTIKLEVNFEQSIIDPKETGDLEIINKARWRKITRDSMPSVLNKLKLINNNDKINKKEKALLARLFTRSAEYYIRDLALDNINIIGSKKWIEIPASSLVDQYLKGNIDTSLEENERPLNDKQIFWIDNLYKAGLIDRKFNKSFFTRGNSRNAEEAGILSAMKGSTLVLIITLIVSFPLGVMASIYLEEFAPKNKITDLIEVNINNLAAVPSIVFGLLGLAIFLNVIGLPRSTPLVGGLVLSLMTLPYIIIASRVSIKAVPPSIREAAMGLGASKMQAVFHHVLPLALPGMLTGTIIGMARALGETAPLLMIGMIAFIVDVPSNFTDPSTVLPAQIYLWSDQPEKGFGEKTAAAIIILLAFLLTMNALAVYLRNKFERKW